MAARQREWAARARDALFDLLGRKCAWCGTTGESGDWRDQLTFDCIFPMGDQHHRAEWSSRISFYRQQHAAGNLQVLCAACNGKKGDSITDDGLNWDHTKLTAEAPF